MEIARRSRDDVSVRSPEGNRRNWQKVVDSVSECPAGEAIVVNLAPISEKALKQARFNLLSAFRNAVDDGKLDSVPDVHFGEAAGTLVIVPASDDAEDDDGEAEATGDAGEAEATAGAGDDGSNVVEDDIAPETQRTSRRRR